MKEMRAQAAERVKKASGGHIPTPVLRGASEKLKKMIEDIQEKEDEKEREVQQHRHHDL
jgi:hypothetical protein